MSIESLREQFGAHAKDINLNLSTVLTEQGSPELTEKQIYGIALASAYATKSLVLIDAITDSGSFAEVEIEAAKGAACLMAMNNIYYRFIHLVKDEEYHKLPAQLRMNFMANPGVPKIDFEAFALAVSAINGCGMCIEAHVHTLEKHGLSKRAVQSVIRIAAVINAAAQALITSE